jgi:hypothetical protein
MRSAPPKDHVPELARLADVFFAALRAGVVLAARRFAEAFFTEGRFAADFLAAGFLAAAFLAGAFFAVVTGSSSLPDIRRYHACRMILVISTIGRSSRKGPAEGRQRRTWPGPARSKCWSRLHSRARWATSFPEHGKQLRAPVHQVPTLWPESAKQQQSNPGAIWSSWQEVDPLLGTLRIRRVHADKKAYLDRSLTSCR